MRQNPIRVIQDQVKRQIRGESIGKLSQSGALGSSAVTEAGVPDPATGLLVSAGLFDWTLWEGFRFQ